MKIGKVLTKWKQFKKAYTMGHIIDFCGVYYGFAYLTPCKSNDYGRTWVKDNEFWNKKLFKECNNRGRIFRIVK